MTYTPLPENWQELMAGYALGDLSSEEAETVQRWLTEDPLLISEITHFQEVLALMPYGLEDSQLPSHLRDKILTQAVGLSQITDSEEGVIHLEEGAGERAENVVSFEAVRRRVPWSLVGGAIAALLLVTLGVDNYRLRQDTQEYQASLDRLQQEAKKDDALIAALKYPKAQVHALEGAENAAGKAGTLVFVPEMNQVTLVTNLPKLPAEKIYRLWAMPANATKPTYCGEFKAEAIASWSPPEAVCGQNSDRMLITAELASDPPIPKGELVMKSKESAS
jgi:hypothetical protein